MAPVKPLNGYEFLCVTFNKVQDQHEQVILSSYDPEKLVLRLEFGSKLELG